MTTALTRVHSIDQRNVAMRDADVVAVVRDIEACLLDESLSMAPALRNCVMPDGWIPIASLLNYTHIGRNVWPYGGVGVVSDCITAFGSVIVELSADSSCVRKKPLPVQMREQLEAIYAEHNYSKDLHLQLLEDREGFALVDTVCSTYRRTQALLQLLPNPALQARLVRDAIECSAELCFKAPEKVEDRMGYVRRRTLSEKICAFAEWVLEPPRLASDRFLFEVCSDHEGYVPVATLVALPRMRKLCHPQVAAVAHVLSKSEKLHVVGAQDEALVRHRRQWNFNPNLPRSNGAPPLPPTPRPSLRAAVTEALDRLLGDATILFDLRIQRALVEASVPEALVPGGMGARVRIEALAAHPHVSSLLQAEGDVSESRLHRYLPKPGESKVIRVCPDGQHLERLRPTPEVRELLAAPGPPEPAHFSVMTFNILAEMLCTTDQFPGVASAILDWDQRRWLIEREVAYRLPDILCVQELQGRADGELDGDHRAALGAALQRLGYDHRYVRKGRKDVASWPGLQIGNAVFWREATFEYQRHEGVFLSDAIEAACVDEASRAHFGRGVQVALFVVLRHRETGRSVIAVTTHLSCNFQEPSLQLVQAQSVLCHAARLVREEGPDTGVVLGADLNSIPGSGVYRLATEGFLPSDHAHAQVDVDGVTLPKLDQGAHALGANGHHNSGGATCGAMTQPLPLRSVYASVLGAPRGAWSPVAGGQALLGRTRSLRRTCPPSRALVQAASPSSQTLPGRHPTLWAHSITSSSVAAFCDPRTFSACRVKYADAWLLAPMPLAAHGVGCPIFASPPSHPLLLCPLQDHVRKEGQLPSSLFPSDHVPLMAAFRFDEDCGSRPSLGLGPDVAATPKAPGGLSAALATAALAGATEEVLVGAVDTMAAGPRDVTRAHRSSMPDYACNDPAQPAVPLVESKATPPRRLVRGDRPPLPPTGAPAQGSSTPDPSLSPALPRTEGDSRESSPRTRNGYRRHQRRSAQGTSRHAM